MLEKLQDLGVESVVNIVGPRDHEFAHQIRMPNSDLQGDVASGARAEEVDSLDRERSEKRGGVIYYLLEGQRAIDVGDVSVPLLLYGNYLPSLREGRQNLFE